MIREADELKQQVIDAIKDEIDRQGLTQIEVGKRCGMSRSHVNSVLMGTDNGVSVNKILKMADVLDLEVNLKVSRRRKKK